MRTREKRRRFRAPLLCALIAAAVTLAIPLHSAVSPAAPPTEQQKKVDRAIVDALKYLASQQLPSGAWRIDAFGESTAATSLAVMAFMAAGHVPGEGPYGEQMERGIRWVIEHQEPDGMIIHRKSHGPLYSHGISTLMLAEAAGMVDESLARRCRLALEKAVALILRAQEVPKASQHAGGWRYQTTSQDSDLSVTGWQLLALRAAKNIGCDVPAKNIEMAVEYVKRCSVRGGAGFAYQPGQGATPTRTGTGILELEICGEHESREAVSGADYLLRQPLDERDHYFFYGVYYCSVGMFNMGGDYWTKTRDHLVSLLLPAQQADGSWLSRNGSERSSGTVYATSMAVLGLAVEYRYLPIYQR